MPGTRALTWAAAGVVAAAVIVGLALRLEDPLSNPVNSGHLYPPGLHALVATAWILTGADLDSIAHFLPPVLGAVGVLGVGILLWRNAGRAAAAIGAVAMAVLPEGIFRTTMLAPTALDLALLPFLLIATLELVRGRLWWALPCAAMAMSFAFAHPWLLALLAPAGAVFVALSLLLPWRNRWPAPNARGLALAVAIVGGASALSFSGCGGACGPGFDHVVPGGLDFLSPLLLLPVLGGAAILWIRAPRLQAWLDGRVASIATPTSPASPAGRGKGPRSLRWRAVWSLAIAVATVALVVPALAGGLPDHVDPVRMFGMPVLVLAAVALAALPFLASPAAHAGASLAAATAPLSLYNPLDSPYWPHRTAVYLGLALVLLAGVAAGGILRALPHAARMIDRLPRLADRIAPRPAQGMPTPQSAAPPTPAADPPAPRLPTPAQPLPEPAAATASPSGHESSQNDASQATHSQPTHTQLTHSQPTHTQLTHSPTASSPTTTPGPSPHHPPVKAHRHAPRAAILAPLVAGLLLCTAVYAATPSYDGGWYRLQDECGMQALRDVAGAANLHPEALVILGAWQPKLVVTALADDASRIWYSQAYFKSQAARDGLRHRTVLVVVDPHLAAGTPGADLSFLSGPGWERTGTWCHGPDGPAFTLHRFAGAPT